MLFLSPPLLPPLLLLRVAAGGWRVIRRQLPAFALLRTSQIDALEQQRELARVNCHVMRAGSRRTREVKGATLEALVAQLAKQPLRSRRRIWSVWTIPFIPSAVGSCPALAGDTTGTAADFCCRMRRAQFGACLRAGRTVFRHRLR